MPERQMYRGDSFVFDVQVKQPTGAAIDITGWTMWFTAKRYVSDPDNQAVIRQDNGALAGIVFTDAVNGKAEVTVAPIATRQFPDVEDVLVYDVQVKDLLGHVFTVEFGTLAVTPDVTRAIT